MPRPRPHRPSARALVPLVLILGGVWVAVISYGFVSSLGTKIDVQDIKKPDVNQDRQASARRIGRLTDAQLIALANRIRAAQRRQARDRKRRGEQRPRSNTSSPLRGAATPRGSGTAADGGSVDPVPNATARPHARPAPRPDPQPQPTTAPTAAPTPAPSDAAASSEPQADDPPPVVGVQVPAPLQVCGALVAVNC